VVQFSNAANEPVIVKKAPVGTRRSMSDLTKVRIWQFVIIGGFLLLWQTFSGRGLDPFYFSSPAGIAQKLLSEFVTYSFYRDLGVTAIELFGGYIMGAIFGIGTGVIFARWNMLAQIFDPILAALNSIPRVALAPLMIVWLGIDMAPKIVLSATLVFFLTFFNTLAGMRNVSTGLVDVARILGSSDSQIFTKVMLPAAAPWIMTGLKMSLPFALIGVIVGEFLAASQGLGYRLNFYSTSYNTTGTFAMLFVMMACMMGLNTLVVLVEKRIMKWKPRGAFQVDAAI
jgi:NitT/TauT family transport system permease protein